MRRRGDVGYVMQDGKLPNGFEGPDMPEDMWKNQEDDDDDDRRCVHACVNNNSTCHGALFWCDKVIKEWCDKGVV
jgi:hypothetical protein